MPAPARRLVFALAVSVLGHAAVLAGAPLGPGLGELSIFPQGKPVRARLAPLPAPEEPAIFPGVPPANIAQAPVAPQEQDGGTEREKDKAAGLPVAETFYPGAEVDERAEATNYPDVEYPEAAFAAGVTGVVRLQLKIDHRGVLREAVVLSGRPAGVFEDAALKAARALRFKPALRNGVPVGSIKLIEVPFEPDCLRTGSCIPESAPR